MQMLASNPSSEQLSALYRQHVAMVRARVAQLLAAGDMVEDVTQDVFVDFMRFARKNDVVDVVGLLYHIATCTAVKRLDRGRRENGTIDVDTSELSVVDERIDSLENRVMFKKVMASVKEDLATVALYYHVEGMSQEEIGKLTQLSQREVSRQLGEFAKRVQKYAETDRPTATTKSSKDQVHHGRP